MVCGIRDETLSWPERVQVLEATLRAAAPDAVQAMVRTGPAVVRLSNLWKRLPAAPYAEQRGRVPMRLSSPGTR